MTDLERPLDPRGERDAAKMGKRWSQWHLMPDLIMSRLVARALATANIGAQELGVQDQEDHAAASLRLTGIGRDSGMMLITWSIQWGRGADGSVDLDRIATCVFQRSSTPVSG